MSLTSEFSDWKNHPITKRVFQELKETERRIAEQLTVEAGIDPLENRFKAGYIAALRDFYLIRLAEDEGDSI